MRVITGAKRLVADALKVVAGLPSAVGVVKPLVQMDSAFYGRGAVGAAIHAGAEVSVTVRLDRTAKAAIAAIAGTTWNSTMQRPDSKVRPSPTPQPRFDHVGTLESGSA